MDFFLFSLAAIKEMVVAFFMMLPFVPICAPLAVTLIIFSMVAAIWAKRRDNPRMMQRWLWFGASLFILGVIYTWHGCRLNLIPFL